MLRLDYKEQGNGTFNVTVVSETEGKHALCGRLNLSAEEWKKVWVAFAIDDKPDTWDIKEPFFKFNNLDESNVENIKQA